jgi:hypothetical protein
MEFLTDRSMLAQWADEPGSAARYFRTPLRLMHAHLVQLRAEGVLSVRTSRPSPIEQAIQGDLDL